MLTPPGNVHATRTPHDGAAPHRRTCARHARAGDQTDFRRLVYGLRDNGLVRRSGSGRYRASDDRTSCAFSATRRHAFAELHPSAGGTLHPNVSFEYSTSASFPPRLASFIVRELDMAAALWDHRFATGTTVRVFLVTEQDRGFVASIDWLQSNLPPILDRFERRDERPFVAGGGGYWTVDGRPIGSIYLATASWLSLDRTSLEWAQVARHEFFHIVQDYAAFGTGRIRPTSGADARALLPQHFVEGAANAVSYLTSYGNLGWSSDAMDWLVWQRGGNYRTWIDPVTLDDAMRLMLATEQASPEAAFEMSYAVGALMYEWLIGTYGLGGFERLLDQLATAESFDEALSRALGITQARFYAAVAAYVVSSFAAVRPYPAP